MSERWWTLPLAAVCVLVAQAQVPLQPIADTTGSQHPFHASPWAIDTSMHHQLEITATGLFDSNRLRNDLVLGLWRGGTLDREIRQRSEGTNGDRNRAGYQLEGLLSYAWGTRIFGDPRLRPRLSVAFRELAGLRYADDLYRTTFFGNADLQDQVAELAPTDYERISYQTFGFGIEDRTTRSFVSLSIVNGRSFEAARIDRADLFTATDGRYLRLDLDGDYSRSDTAATNGWATKGIGAAVSGEFRRPFDLIGQRGWFTVGVQDLGAVAWNDGSLRTVKDSTILYEGIQVDDVLDLDGVLIGGEELQDSLGLSYKRGSLLRPLPALAYVRGSLAAPGNMIYSAEVDLRHLPGYAVRTTVMAQHIFHRLNRAGVEVAYGGFGGWRVGASIERWLCSGVRLGLRTTNMIGLFSASARGKSVLVNVEYVW